ncbi:DNA/RNA nuclease SfsA [Woodsholea maritima]|uniref:DNA/RNA nuclease SfsA n=1 Tax=Woodsholea maritima TaxID=240237 RepID=UPI0003A4D1D4|nr:DNA/RNA nuclease SfsA [Woodsholea maritima]
MQFDPPLEKAVLKKRYKRFLADIALNDGRLVTAHCPNPGAMAGLNAPNSTCWVSYKDDPKRKLPYTLEMIEVERQIVGINTQHPNRLAEDAIAKGLIGELTGYDTLRREVKYGQNSRIDLLLQDPGKANCYVEVKNVHFVRTPKLAEFPDGVTARGTKHLGELISMVQEGHRAVQLFIIQRDDIEALSPAGDIDPAYAGALRAAQKAGVEILAYACEVSPEAITVKRAIEVQI